MPPTRIELLRRTVELKPVKESDTPHETPRLEDVVALDYLPSDLVA
jgi:hypothetical protein